MIDKHGVATGGPGAVDIPPPITDEKTAVQINAMAGGGTQQHAGLRFSAIAGFTVAGAGVITDFDCVERRHGVAKFPVHGLDLFAALSSTADIGLVRHDDQEETRLLQLRAVFGDASEELKLSQRRRWKRKAVANDRPVQDAVAIEKDGGPGYFVLSHFVCAAFSAG